MHRLLPQTRWNTYSFLHYGWQDLTYLIANVTAAARQKVDRDLPPDAAPEGEDATRRRVEQLVDDVCLHCTNGWSRRLMGVE